MKKLLLTTALFIPLVIGMSFMSCKPDSFTEQDAAAAQRKMSLFQDSLKKAGTLLTDTLNKEFSRVTYTLNLVDASKSALWKSLESEQGISGASVTLTQGSTIVTKTSAATGLVVFDNLKLGYASVHIVLTGYSELNAVVYFQNASSSTEGYEWGNVFPLIPLTGTATGTIKGKVTCESDLTNRVPEVVPTGTKVIATVSTSSAALLNIKNVAGVTSISYDNLSLEAVTDANGDFTMTVPATTLGLDYTVKVADFAVNQSLLMLTKGGLPVTGIQSVPTYFGSGYLAGASTIPSVGAITVTIGAPDYTFTPASATAVISNPNGIEYIQITNNGNYYDYANSSGTFSSFMIDNPAPSTGGTNAYINPISINSYGKITSIPVTTQGTLYATTNEGAAFTLPYIKTAAKAEVLSVNGSGAILTWRVMPAQTGIFYSSSNLEFVKSTGVGTNVTLSPFPTISDAGSNLTFVSATMTPSAPLGTGYVVGDQFTLSVISGMNDPMTGIVHMTTGSVTGISVVSGGTNYITGKYGVSIASPGLSGTTATATATLSNGRIATIAIAGAGSGYTSAPVVTIVNYVEKVQARATALPVVPNADGSIASFTMTSTGNGYLTVPTVTLTPSITGVGSGASATAVLTNGSVSSLTVVNGGTGYTGVNYPAATVNGSIPTVNVKGSGTTNAFIYLGTGKRTIVD
jgi:hypothetical protein